MSRDAYPPPPPTHTHTQSPDIIQDGTLATIPLRAVPAADALVARLAGAAGAAAPGIFYFAAAPGAAPWTGAGAAAAAGGIDVPAALLVAVHAAPFRVELFAEGGAPGTPAVAVGRRGLTYLEHRRRKDGGGGGSGSGADGAAAAAPAAAERRVLHWGEDGKAVYEDAAEHAAEGGAEAAAGAAGAAAPTAAPAGEGAEAGLWEETFGSHVDSKPFGPQSVGFDVTFPGATHLFGIPEHASSHALKATDGSEGGAAYAAPYRLYNLDVFEYELDNPMALYGSIPFLVAGAPGGGAAGAYWNNPTETYVDVAKAAAGASARWMSEAGVFDLTLFPGRSGKAVVAAFTNLVGTAALPPLFALGYHQCRWNYKDEADVFGVDAKFEELAFPYDVLWLDIEHTDGKRYFTWDANLFPAPAAMQDKLAARGHKMVTIIDPHIKKDAGYWVHAEAQAKSLYVKKADGGEYDGWCWPGSSGYLDFTADATRGWWADQFALDKYKGSTLSLYTWNDMNEPSVFNGPEVSMHKDARALSGAEHREWHNLYGFYQTMATAEGQLRRTPDRNARSFVLTRSFFAGSQKYAAMWTGDNEAKWEHLRAAAPMLLTIGVSGMAFAGADVGGFFKHPTPELMVRWYQAGSFQPFFRAHAHIETPRREPWLFGDATLGALRDIVRTRYSYLPLWYTLFAVANATGLPPMRPMWLEHPAEAGAYGLDDQWCVGDALLVKPVVTEGAATAAVWFPGGAPWYDAETLALVRPAGAAAGEATVAAPLERIPVFVRGGAVVPRQMRPRRASAAMRDDPFTLVVALGADGRAAGHLYLDDGASYDFARKGAFRLRRFDYAPGAGGGRRTAELRSTQPAGGKVFAPRNTVERILVAGAKAAPSAVSASEAGGAPRALAFTYDAAADVVTIKKPDVHVAYDFVVTLVW